MALSKVQIISNALSLMGKKIIVELGQDDLSDAAEQAFDMLVPAEFETGFWRFATTQAQLSQINAQPITDRFRYIYKLPANYLKMVCLIPQNWDFEIYENKQLYCGLNNPLYIEYIFMPEITNFPFSFCKFISYLIADYLSLSNAQSVQYQGVFAQKAEIWKSIALANDAQNRPQTPLQSKPIITNRFVGTLING